MQYTGYHQYIFISSTGGFVFFTNVYFVLRVLFHGFMPKIIFFYAEKLRAIYWCVFFFVYPKCTTELLSVIQEIEVLASKYLSFSAGNCK